MVDAVIDAVGKALQSTQIPLDDAGMQGGLFDLTFLVRAQNALKVIRLLCRETHWEFAAPAVRQVFELVLTAEYIAAQDDRRKALLRYQRFGLLQVARRDVDSALYNRSTGRAVDEERLRIAQHLLDTAFDDFKVTRGKKTRWATTWSGMTTRQLAEASSSPIRRHQYDQLFSDWSEQAHAAPAVLLPTMLPGQRDLAKVFESDDVRIAETLASAVTFVIELWTLLPSVPRLDPLAALQWTGELLEEGIRLGAVPKATDHASTPT